MTVIVWDGETLATDASASDGLAKWSSLKAWYHGEGEDRVILSGTGSLHVILAMRNWFMDGALLNELPSIQCTSHFCHFLVVSPYVGLYWYEQGNISIEHGYKPIAFGEGMEVALGALFMGATSEEAVKAANQHSVHCGPGVKTYKIERN